MNSTGGSMANGQVEPGVSSSPSGMKRARDYAEELKGLNNSDDDEDSEGQSAPAAKRLKPSEADNDKPPSMDAGLAKGADFPSNAGKTRGTPALQGNVDSPKPVASDRTRRDPSEDGEINSPVEATLELQVTHEPERTSKDSIPSVSPPIESRPSFLENNPIASALEASQPSPAVIGGEEQADRQLQTMAGQTDAESSTTMEAPSKKPQPGSTFEVGGKYWKFPSQTGAGISAATDGVSPAFWDGWLEPWILSLMVANPNQHDALDRLVVQGSIDKYLSTRSTFIQGSKKEKTAARDTAQQVFRAFRKRDWNVHMSSALERFRQTFESAQRGLAQQADAESQHDRQPPGRQPKHTQSGRVQQTHPEDQPDVSYQTGSDDVPGDDEELRLQARYFPDAQDPSQYCLSCAGVGHRAQGCPQIACRFCGSRKHTHFGCPTRQRCTKCHQVGHGHEDCVEKLGLAVDERQSCAYCGSDHEEADCFEIWRSFDPTTAVKTVRHIPAFCYTCGAEGHYGPECGLPGMGREIDGQTTWSQVNRNRYINGKSQDVAVAWVGISSTIPQSGEFSVRGRATRKAHTYFVSSDDDSEEDNLIHTPIQKKAPRRSGIKVNLASSKPHDGAHHSNGAPAWQPPLPPGPPPTAHNGPLGSLRTAPPGSLPPRPNTFVTGRPTENMATSGNRGGRGGRSARGERRLRGGRRGRGRGRGN
ncbi:hypothetical protein F4778DRAFT_317110 [Xylariomycetidae sp. FL2044]|nr:hypothetical protein F4778DRAFT_317110 [Xylariomycetidae sp. FL2044]